MVEHSEKFEENKKQINLQLNLTVFMSVGGEHSAFTRYNYHQVQH